LRRVWTQLLASVSAAVVACMTATALAQAPPKNSAKVKTAERAYETTLAGLRPGRDLTARAVRLYKEADVSPSGDGSELIWNDPCARQMLVIETNATHQIQTVRVAEAHWLSADCAPPRPAPWKTGQGLHLGETIDRIEQLYGKPDSVSPSTKGGQQLELWYYAFDWAGPDVPQVMEVVCTIGKDGQPGRVVEITLAASSL
jgi:hypothetical protein